VAAIWVYAETVDGEPRPVVLELLTKARSLGEVEAIALGPGASKAAAALGAHGAKTVYVHEDPAFRDLLAVPAVDLLADLIAKHKPDLLLFGMTYDGRDIASRLSARLGTALIANATGLEQKDGAFARQLARLRRHAAGGRPSRGRRLPRWSSSAPRHSPPRHGTAPPPRSRR